MADILLIVPHYLSLPDLLVVVEQFVSHGRYLHVLRKFNVRSSTLTSLSVMIPNGNIIIVLNNRFHADTSYIRPLLRPNSLIIRTNFELLCIVVHAQTLSGSKTTNKH